MTAKQVVALFEKHSDGEFLEYGRIAPDRRLHRRPDVHAFLLLDRLASGPNAKPGRDIVVDARYEEIFLDLAPKDIARAATEDDVIDLIRCGVRYDEDHLCFCMFT